MNEIFYHASNIGNLTEIKPLSKLHGSGEAVSYFTPIRAYALFYLRDMEINHVTCGVNKDGIVVYHEQFLNQLQTLYQGRSGYLYICENKNMELAHTNGVWAASQSLIPSKTEYVADVYAEILKAEESGAIHVVRYDSLPDEKKQEYVDMMKNVILKQGYLSSNSKKALFFKENFAEAWKIAQHEKYPHLIIIHGAPGSGKSTTASLLHKKLRSPWFEFGWISEFRNLNPHTEITWEQETDISFENLVLVVKNYIRHGFKNIIITDINFDSQILRLPEIFDGFQYRLFTLYATDETLKTRILKRDNGNTFRDWESSLKLNALLTSRPLLPNEIRICSESISADEVVIKIMEEIMK